MDARQGGQASGDALPAIFESLGITGIGSGVVATVGDAPASGLAGSDAGFIDLLQVCGAWQQRESVDETSTKLDRVLGWLSASESWLEALTPTGPVKPSRIAKPLP